MITLNVPTGWFRNRVPLLPASLVSSLLPLLIPSSQTSSSDSSSPLPSCDEKKRQNVSRVPGEPSNGSNGMNSSTIPDIGTFSPLDLNRLRAHLMVFPNRLAIESLMRFLNKISQYSDYNSMTVSNLSIVWTPSLCREESASNMASMSTMVSMSPSSCKTSNKNKNMFPKTGSLENQLKSSATSIKTSKMIPSATSIKMTPSVTSTKMTPSATSTKMTPSASVSSNNFLLESVSNFMKDARVLVEFLITNVDTLFCISRSDLMLPSPPSSVIIPTSGGHNSYRGQTGHNSFNSGHRLSSQPSSKTSTLDSRNGANSLRLSSFATQTDFCEGRNPSIDCVSSDTYQPSGVGTTNDTYQPSGIGTTIDTYQPSSVGTSGSGVNIPRGITPPSIGCRRLKVIHNASPYDIFLRIILERRTWDPLVTEIIDEGSGVQKIKHCFSPFLRPSSPSNGGSLRINGQNRYIRCKSLTRSTNSPCHRRSVSTSSSDSRRRGSFSRSSSGDCDLDQCLESQTRYLTIRRKWPEKLDPSVQVIQIHEESLDDPSSRTKTSTGMPSYICDWSIKAGPVSADGNEPSSELSVAIYSDLKGRPLCWYKKSFPRLIDCYLHRISSFFNHDPSTNPDGLQDATDTSMTTFGGNAFQSRGAETGNRTRRSASFDPFCCISMKHVVQA